MLPYHTPWICPVDLRKMRHWTTWRFRDNNKVPNADPGKPETWMTYQEAYSWYESSYNHPSLHLEGLSFELGCDHSERLYGLDLDDCVISCHREGHSGPVEVILKPWAEEIVRLWPGYLEVSPSGKGVKGIGRARIPAGYGCRGVVTYENGKERQVENYDQGRAFTITGWAVEGCATSGKIDCQWFADWLAGLYLGKKFEFNPEMAGDAPNVPEDELFEAFYNSSGRSYENKRLFNQDPSEDGDEDSSKIDYRLMCKIAHWTNNYIPMMLRWFLQSARSNREKIHKHPTYLQRTAEKAVAATDYTANSLGFKPKKVGNSPLSGAVDASPSRQRKNLPSDGGSVTQLTPDLYIEYYNQAGVSNRSPIGGGVHTHYSENAYFKIDEEHFLAPGIHMPDVNLSLYESICEQTKVRMQLIDDPLVIMIVVKPCGKITCPDCGPIRKDKVLRWYGTVMNQWDQIWMMRSIRRKQIRAGMWITFPGVKLEDGRLNRAIFTDRPLPGSEPVGKLSLVSVLESELKYWTSDNVRATAMKLIRMPSMESSPSVGKWKKHPRQCSFDMVKTSHAIESFLKGRGAMVVPVDIGSGVGLKYRVQSDEQDFRWNNFMAEGYAADGGGFEF